MNSRRKGGGDEGNGGTVEIYGKSQLIADGGTDSAGIGGGAKGKMITRSDGTGTGTIAYTKAPNKKNVGRKVTIK